MLCRSVVGRPDRRCGAPTAARSPAHSRARLLRRCRRRSPPAEGNARPAAGRGGCAAPAGFAARCACAPTSHAARAAASGRRRRSVARPLPPQFARGAAAAAAERRLGGRR
eukprot:1884561-Prymnesium_polylepis.1